jgi:hypothetical protein
MTIFVWFALKKGRNVGIWMEWNVKYLGLDRGNRSLSGGVTNMQFTITYCVPWHPEILNRNGSDRDSNLGLVEVTVLVVSTVSLLTAQPWWFPVCRTLTFFRASLSFPTSILCTT